METRPHWSYSSLNQYLRCPLQFYFERVLKLPRSGVGSGLVLGSAVHQALAIFHRRLQRKEPTEPNLLRDSFLDEWRNREQEERIEFRGGETREGLIELGVALLETYAQQPPSGEIVAVERRTWIPLRTSDDRYLETPLVAIADLIVRVDGYLKITEFKTSGRAYGEFEVETSLQATCYVNAVLETFGEWANVEYAVLVKTKTPKVQRLLTSRTEEDLRRLGDLVENVERAVQHEIFYPVETPLNCSTCPYRGPCREWSPTRRSCSRPDDLVTVEGVAAC
ncbi:MAG TPA: PD-(D/E)XK nuclease family protein [Pirellulaceae bacterium]|jgi:CRISPR/Cas system-associated exonuclease Cas4 (RecB family)|nr:PD-(D/E)XK nuclease family protein [Pirellulaceae bacterium]